jgi:ribosomal protein L37AE/L43A
MIFDEFEKRFATEQECRKYPYELRFPKGYACPKCGNGKRWEAGEALYECSECGHQASIISGTIFQDTRKPLRSWFIAIWWITTQKYGASAKGLQQILGLKSYQTAWTWLHKIRKAMVIPGREKLSGKVGMDESYLGGKNSGKRGRGSENKSLAAVGWRKETWQNQAGIS